MNVASGGGTIFFAVLTLVYLAALVGLVVAIVLSIRAWMQTAAALRRIAAALERRPPG